MSDVAARLGGRVYRVRRTTPKRTRWARGRANQMDFTPAEVTPQGLPRVAEPKAKRGPGGGDPVQVDGPAGRERGERDDQVLTHDSHV